MATESAHHGISGLLGELGETVRESRLVRTAVQVAGAFAAAALIAGLAIGVASIPVVGTVGFAVMGSLALGVGGAAAGALASRDIARSDASGSTGLRRMAIGAAVGAVAGAAAGIAGFVAMPVFTAGVATLALELEAGVAGAVAGGVAWDRVRDVPVSAGEGLDA